MSGFVLVPQFQKIETVVKSSCLFLFQEIKISKKVMML